MKERVEAFKAGNDAFYSSEAPDTNPYNPSNEEDLFRTWNSGWRYAWYLEAEREYIEAVEAAKIAREKMLKARDNRDRARDLEEWWYV